MAGGILPESPDQLGWSPPESPDQLGWPPPEFPDHLCPVLVWVSQMYPSITPLSSAHQALDEQLYGETLDHLQVPRDGQPQGADQSQSPADQSITTL